MDEGAHSDEARVEPSTGYGVFGERVAGVLEAAEQAAEKIVEDARREAHTLAGAVAFFGYLDASRLASDLERIFEGPAMADPERLRDLVAKLRGALKALPYTL